MADLRTFSSKAFSDALKLVNENQYEKLFLKPLEDTYAAQENQLSAQKAYDITNAYDQYMQQQRTISQSNIFKGTQDLLKNQLSQNLKSDIQESEIDYASGLQQLVSGFNENKQKVDEYFTEQGEQLKKFFETALSYSGTDWNQATTTKEQGGLGLLENVDGAYSFTDEGNRYFQELLYGEETVDDGGINQALNEAGLYDWYVENRANINEIIGTNREDWSFNKTENIDFLSKANPEKSTSINDSNYKHLFFSTEDDIINYYKSSKNKDSSYRSNAANENIKIGKVEITINGKKFDITKYSQPITSGDAFNYVKSKIESNKLSKGDIIEYQGTLYLISKDSYYYYLRKITNVENKKTSNGGGFGGGGGGRW